MKIKKSLIVILFFITIIITVKESFSQSVPLKIDNYGFLYVAVIINDSITTDFLLDTGGGMNVLSNKIYQKIKPTAKFHGYETGFRHDGERISGEIYEIPSISIDKYKIQDALIGMYAPLDEYGIDGIISLKFFEHTPFTIDFKNKTLTVETKKSMKSIEKNSQMIPILLDIFSDYAIDMYIPLELNNSVVVNAEFDTGSGYNGFVMNPYYMSMLGLDSTNTKMQNYTTPITKTPLHDYIGTLSSVKLKGVNSTEIVNLSSLFRENMIHQALIGSAMFKDKAITIDIANKKMYVR
ncbi:MAG: retropepsin-like domain-containing protein [Ignavibacteria bacterium]|nr:retropepsin-like domain-containing protein [Ignavibacteria bacterium]